MAIKQMALQMQSETSPQVSGLHGGTKISLLPTADITQIENGSQSGCHLSC